MLDLELLVLKKLLQKMNRYHIAADCGDCAGWPQARSLSSVGRHFGRKRLQVAIRLKGRSRVTVLRERPSFVEEL